MAAEIKRKSRRKRYKPRPGLLKAAKELGCTYSHLRRVILGERKTPLLKRYKALNSSQQPTTKTT